VVVDGELVTLTTDRIRYREIFDSLPSAVRSGDPLYGDFGRAYYPLTLDRGMVDCSFAITADGGALIVVECNALDGRLTRFGFPIRVLLVGASGRVGRTLTRQAVDRLRQLAAEHSLTDVVVADPGSREVVGELGRACLAAGATLHCRLHAVADLCRTDDELRADVRKSVKSLLNWGRRSLDLRYCNAEDSSSVLFESYRELHARVAGRVTRSADSWDAMLEAIVRGQAELTVIGLNGELVGGLLVVDGTCSSYYASAAYVRERFEQPIAHWPLMNAALRAKGRGIRWFDFGELLSSGEGSDKETRIGFFKKAFTSRIEIRPEWHLVASNGGDTSS
jgi:hypothetical protein